MGVYLLCVVWTVACGMWNVESGDLPSISLSMIRRNYNPLYLQSVGRSGPTKKEREGIDINEQLNRQRHNILPSKRVDND